MRLRLIALTIPLAALALAACSPTANVTEPTASSTPEAAISLPAEPTNDATLAKYSTDLPDGYTWPEEVPASSSEMIWACIHLDAAWAAIDAGDQAEADRLVAQVYDNSTLWDSDPPTFGDGTYARDWGWHGICTQQLGLISYPVQGLALWRPNQTSCDPDHATDGGPRQGALGTPELDSDGYPVAYIVAEGDNPDTIQKRFCITNVMERNGLNRYIQPGERLTIDPTAPML